MSEISKAKITETVKSEYEAINKWKKIERFGHGKMMIDTNDGEIWSDVFLNEDDCNRYKKDTIIQLICSYDYDDIVTGYVEDAVDKLKKTGWEITA